MKCPSCNERKGKRACKINAAQSICPLCCASIRGAGCAGCFHYQPSLAYQREKRLREKHFTVELIPEVDELCDAALNLAEKGALAEAEAAIEKLRRQHPHYHSVLYALGVCHGLRGESDQAIACFERAVEIFPLFAHAHYNLGTAYCQKVEIERAVGAYEKAIAADGRDGPVGRKARKHLDEFEAICQKNGVSLTTHIDNVRIFDQAFAALRNANYQVAINLFAQILKTEKGHVQSYGNMGLAYAGLGNKQKALECLDQAIQIDPDYEPALVNRRVVENLREGANLPPIERLEISYYSEFRQGKKSHMDSSS